MAVDKKSAVGVTQKEGLTVPIILNCGMTMTKILGGFFAADFSSIVDSPSVLNVLNICRMWQALINTTCALTEAIRAEYLRHAILKTRLNFLVIVMPKSEIRLCCHQPSLVLEWDPLQNYYTVFDKRKVSFA